MPLDAALAMPVSEIQVLAVRRPGIPLRRVCGTRLHNPRQLPTLIRTHPTMVAQHQAPGNRLHTAAAGAPSSSQTHAINDRPDSSWFAQGCLPRLAVVVHERDPAQLGQAGLDAPRRTTDISSAPGCRSQAVSTVVLTAGAPGGAGAKRAGPGWRPRTARRDPRRGAGSTADGSRGPVRSQECGSAPPTPCTAVALVLSPPVIAPEFPTHPAAGAAPPTTHPHSSADKEATRRTRQTPCRIPTGGVDHETRPRPRSRDPCPNLRRERLLDRWVGASCPG